MGGSYHTNESSLKRLNSTTTDLLDYGFSSTVRMSSRSIAKGQYDMPIGACSVECVLLLHQGECSPSGGRERRPHHTDLLDGNTSHCQMHLQGQHVTIKSVTLSRLEVVSVLAAALHLQGCSLKTSIIITGCQEFKDTMPL